MQDLRDKSLTEIKDFCAKIGLKPFKAKEIFKFIHQKLANSIDNFTTLKKEEREKLKESFFISNISPAKIKKGKGVIKCAFALEDGKSVEAVFMNYGKDRKTVCISSQVGCPIGCGFCATGNMGYRRNLSTAEILSQVYYFAQDHKISNIVFMGMGEPFLNFDNVLKAAKILNNESGLNIASRKIVISTIGILPGIKRFSDESKQLRLAWSLVAPFDKTRRKLIKYKGLASIAETIKALAEYQKETKRRITVEYVVLKGINDSEADLKEVVKISRQLDCHVNLIPYNPSPGSSFESGNTDKVFKMLKKIDPKINVTTRNSLGQDIDAACGQLSGSN